MTLYKVVTGTVSILSEKLVRIETVFYLMFEALPNSANLKYNTKVLMLAK